MILGGGPIPMESRGTNLLLDDLGGVDGVAKTETTSIVNDLERLSVSKRLARNISQKLKKKGDESLEDVGSDGGIVSFCGCLGLHVKCSEYRVGSCKDLNINCSNRLSSMQDCKIGKSIVEIIICLSKKIWRKGSRRVKCIDLLPSISTPMLLLPDDVLEMILVMLPWTSLAAASRVCRRWRCLTGTTRFMQRRSEASYQRPCLFLFGVKRHEFNGGEIHALDLSLDQWLKSSHDELKDRFLFSVANIGADVYIVGGCYYSSYLSLRSLKKSLKEVLIFSPVKGSFHAAAPMKEARSEPILGVFEVSSSCNLLHNLFRQRGQPQTKPHASGKSDVYEVPHRFSIRRHQPRAGSGNAGNTLLPDSNSFTYPDNPRNIHSNVAMIAVGGHGSLDEPLDSGEIYDPVTNRWVEIARVPVDFGPVCSGTVCNLTFYIYSEADKLAGFDLENGCWTIIEVSRPPLHLSDYYPKLVSCENRLFLLSVSWCQRDGLLSRREKAARKMWEFNLKHQSWSEVSRHPDAPMDSNAFFVARQNKIYSVEMFRIFGQVLDFVTACDVSDGEIKWNRVSRKHAAHDVDASSCITKSMLVVNL